MSKERKEGLSRPTLITLVFMMGLLAVMAGTTIYMLVELNKPVEISSQLESVEPEVETEPETMPSQNASTDSEDPHMNEQPASSEAPAGMTDELKPYSEIGPSQWGTLKDEGQHMVVVASKYCEPCNQFTDDFLEKYMESNPDIPYYIFETGDHPERVQWLHEQDFAKAIMEAIELDGVPTPTILLMDGHEMLYFHVGYTPYEEMMDIVEETYNLASQ